jgi:hypothetical protein
VTLSRETIVLAGALAQRPGHGGHAWVFLQYLLGFRRLGYEVFFIDWLDGDTPAQRTAGLRWLDDVMSGFGLGDCYALIDKTTGAVYGAGRGEVRERLRRTPALLNVMGYLDDDDLLSEPAMRVFLDIDPGFGQMWRALGLADPFAGHDAVVTIGENVGREDCAIPTCGLDWITTPQPVVLDEWCPAGEAGDALTSVGSWRGPYGPVEYEGRTYGLRVHEFRRFLELPRRSGARLEVALDIHEAEVDDLARLRENGWALADPAVVARDPWSYRGYIRASRGELMIAKNMYVRSNSGWFSDRSICYLAAGRPVLAQDTGLRGRYPTGEGLLVFDDLDQAVAGIEAIAGDPHGHGRAAREIAEEHFDARVVLPRLLERLGVA